MNVLLVVLIVFFKMIIHVKFVTKIVDHAVIQAQIVIVVL